MKEGTKATGVFFLTGLVLWISGGWLASIVCFQPIIPHEVMAENKELAIEVINAWGMVTLKVVIIWALTGGILGVVISRLFMARPGYEHFSPTPRPEGMPKMPGFLSGPKTMAEIYAGFQGLILGVIIGVCGTVFILPLLETELIVVKQLSIRIIFGLIATLIITVPILPFSLGILKKIYERRLLR